MPLWQPFVTIKLPVMVTTGLILLGTSGEKKNTKPSIKLC